MEPNTKLKILSGVKLDNSYTNTIYFTDSVSQYEYFASKTIKQYDSLQYRRKSEGQIHILCPVADIEEASYMMFQNTNYSNRWFYAFILSVEYISDNVTAVFYELDVFQSYMLYFQFGSCFVEREHAMTDNPGDNLLDEPVGASNIVVNSMQTSGYFNDYSIVIWKADTGGGIPNDYVSGVYNGLSARIAPLNENGAQAITNEISDMVSNNELGALVGISCIPEDFALFGHYPVIKEITVGRPGTVNGYSPRNKKLLTYPYNYLCVDNTQASATYRYERFTSSNIRFNLSAMVTPSPEITLTPNNYMIAGDNNYTERLTMTGFPTFASSADSYKAYLAQSGLPVISGASINSFIGRAIGKPGAATNFDIPDVSLSDVISPVANAVSGGVSGFKLGGAGGAVVGAISGAISGSAGELMGIAKASNMPDQIVGGAGGSLTSGVAFRMLDFYFKHMSITAQEAKSLDDFFDMFGYQTNRVKIPNISGRKSWNYVKTSFCNITGTVPVSARNTIINAMNRGITFWKKGDDVGNYALDNSL